MAIDGANVNGTAWEAVCRLCAAQETDPLGRGDKYWQGLDLHFLHHPLAVGLDRPLRGSEFIRDLLVHPASHHQIEHLPLVRR